MIRVVDLENARRQVKAQVPPAGIVRSLIADGVSPEDAEALVGAVQARRRAGRKNLIIGIVALAVGIAITVGTYLNAGNEGGKYTVMYGFFLMGTVYVVRGLTGLRG